MKHPNTCMGLNASEKQRKTCEIYRHTHADVILYAAMGSKVMHCTSVGARIRNERTFFKIDRFADKNPHAQLTMSALTVLCVCVC